jgi:cell wall-associated NlpC family hydrolase
MTTAPPLSVAPIPPRITQIRAMLGLPSHAEAIAFRANLDSARGGADVTTTALQYVGVPYVWGGNDAATGLDCSGFTKLVYGSLGVDLPRVSTDQAKVGTPVASLADARPGDLLAFGSPVDHVGIYLGDGRMVHAAGTGRSVEVADVYRTPTTIRRLVPA